MWGSGGGHCYWGSKRDDSEGIVVIFAWMLSKPHHVEPYVRLYNSLGRHWDSLVCHSRILNLFFPSQATSLALNVLDDLFKEVAQRPRPVVFAAFSGGPKSCMYKLFQILQGNCENVNFNLGRIELVRKCIAGQIYDSSPVDFVSELGTSFAVHPTTLKLSHSPTVLRWGAQAASWALDALFLSRFEAQRAEYWQTLYSSVNMGPILLLCSEDDDLAPFHTICNFASHMRELGGEVKLIGWKNSLHVGHYRHHPEEYRDAVLMLLTTAASCYRERIGNVLQQETASKESSSEMIRTDCDADASTVNCVMSRQTKFSTLIGCPEVKNHKHLGSYTDGQKEELMDIQSYSTESTPSPHDTLDSLLFDIDTPKFIEDWELKPFRSSPLLVDLSVRTSAKSGSINPCRFIRRCRL